VLEKFTIDTFAGHLGETIRIRPDETQSLDATLIEVTDLSERAGPAVAGYDRTPFSLVFLGPPQSVLPQAIYRFEHDEIGAFELFIVPVGRTPQGVRYEAVFS